MISSIIYKKLFWFNIFNCVNVISKIIELMKIIVVLSGRVLETFNNLDLISRSISNIKMFLVIIRSIKKTFWFHTYMIDKYIFSNSNNNMYLFVKETSPYKTRKTAII